jgi:general secretion pathway protein I
MRRRTVLARARGACVAPPGETPASGAAGFTLIEILVAFTIAALLLGALFELFSTGLRSSLTATNYDDAVLLAESALDALSATPLAVGETENHLGRFDRVTTVRQSPEFLTTAALSVPMIYEISVRVTWREGVRQRSILLSTLRAGPR